MGFRIKERNKDNRKIWKRFGKPEGLAGEKLKHESLILAQDERWRRA